MKTLNLIMIIGIIYLTGLYIANDTIDLALCDTDTSCQNIARYSIMPDDHKPDYTD